MTPPTSLNQASLCSVGWGAEDKTVKYWRPERLGVKLIQKAPLPGGSMPAPELGFHVSPDLSGVRTQPAGAGNLDAGMTTTPGAEHLPELVGGLGGAVGSRTGVGVVKGQERSKHCFWIGGLEQTLN